MMQSLPPVHGTLTLTPPNPRVDSLLKGYWISNGNRIKWSTIHLGVIRLRFVIGTILLYRY